MSFKDSEKIKIKLLAGELWKVSKDCPKLTSELRVKIESFVTKLFDVTDTVNVVWIDQLGEPVQRTMRALSLEKMILATKETVSWINASKLWAPNSVSSSLEFALMMRETVDGIGSGKACTFKAFFDGCSREDSVCLHIMENIFHAGKHAKGGAPWEQTEGHTVWTSAQVLESIINVYGYSIEKAKGLSKFLMNSGLIKRYGSLVALPAIHQIEQELKRFAESEYSTIPLRLDVAGLTFEQESLLLGITDSASKIVGIIGPGGTGKTHTISRYIKALLDSEKSVLCCAPTGISAKVLNDSLATAGVDTAKLTCRGVVVLDRAIALARFGGLDCEYAIIDEASMVSVNHLSLIGMLFSVKRLVMLGDPSQLRPVEAGQPFKDLIGNSKVSVFKLFKNMRSDSQKLSDELDRVRSGNGIIHRMIPMAKSPFARDHKEIRENVKIIPTDMKRQMGRWVKSSVDKGYVWLAHTNALVRALSNFNLASMSKFSEDTLDLYLDDVVASYFGAKAHKRQADVSMDIPGLEVYWTADRHGEDVRVYRGFSGVVNGGFVKMNAVTMDGIPKSVTFRLDEVENKIMPWMAKTVHKSQGQSIENVAYLIKTTNAGRHNLELAYTAQSRAKHDAIVISLCDESKSPRLVADTDRETSLGVK